MNAILDEHRFGEMTVRDEFPPRRRPWAFDNGAFKDWRAGRGFLAGKYEEVLEQLRASDSRPDFLVVPDIVAGGAESLAFSERWTPRLWGLGPLYLAVQDGMEIAELGHRVSAYSGIFIGGTTEWKLRTGLAWTRFAHSLGLLCHVGRVGTPKRVRWAVRIGADSIDSSQPLWSFGHMRRFCAAVRGDQMEMFA